MRVVVLGGGLVGGVMARDLARDGEFDVTVADVSAKVLGRLEGVVGLTTVRADLSDAGSIRRVVDGNDLVVGAVPGHMGFAALKAVIEAGKSIVDISFFSEDALALDALARQHGVCAVVDCGIAPGCSNLILGRMETDFDQVDRFICYVGGLPAVRTWPWEYKAPFSPSDVLEEYTRPARYVAAGRMVTMPALSEPEFVEFPEVGTLEAFNTDGLRSLLVTVKVPFMIEKTMRYPGHIEKIRVLRESGFFGTEPIEVGGIRVKPLDVTSHLLFPSWQFGPGEEDLTAMRVIVEGAKEGRRLRRSFEMVDRFDRGTGTTSMARTTGFTCTAGVRLVAQGLWKRKGVSPPEFIGREPRCYDFIMDELAKRGVMFQETITPLG
jgi:saccharopine dehydrogenase-like NADP-dependent oxidoreductase